jgi:hypothetical protein
LSVFVSFFIAGFSHEDPALWNEPPADCKAAHGKARTCAAQLEAVKKLIRLFTASFRYIKTVHFLFLELATAAVAVGSRKNLICTAGRDFVDSTFFTFGNIYCQSHMKLQYITKNMLFLLSF